MDRVFNSLTTSYFFTRFPENWDKKALWSMFSKYGNVFDIYLAGKRTNMGDKFGFVRFYNVRDVYSFELKLKEIRIGSLQLVINLAKYGKRHRISEYPPQNSSKADLSGNKNEVFGKKVDGRTFAEATSGKKRKDFKQNFGQSASTSSSKIVIRSRKEDVERLNRCLVGVVKDFDILSNIWSLLQVEGFG